MKLDREASDSGIYKIVFINPHQASINLNLSDPKSNQDRNLYSKSGQKFNPNGYCYSHGSKVEEAHTSENCNFLKNGHNKLSTRMDIKGGQIWKKDWINGGPTK